jgi:hypothetical protein
MSFSSASLHIGNLWAMQNALLQLAHVAAGARRLRCGDDRLSVEAWEERGMMVLLEKHVHLQKEGGA